MKNDARILINKKKLRKQQAAGTSWRGKVNSRGTFDARKVLNLKRSAKAITNNKIQSRKELIRGSNKMSASAVPFVKKSYSSFKAPNKQVEVSSDGNIWITAQSKDRATASNKAPARQFQPAKRQQMQWTPADVDMDNIEHIGIQDLIDMESLPPAIVSPSPLQSRIPHVRGRTLAEEVLNMQNTMVADQVASASTSQSAQVYITNLCSSVSKQDIMELFGDVGIVKSAEMPQIGTAVVEFYDLTDARKACETYHNRLLDGQPMRCYLQPNTPAQRLSVSQRLGGRVTGATPVKFLPPNPRSRYNPNDVRFTVKLA